MLDQIRDPANQTSCFADAKQILLGNHTLIAWRKWWPSLALAAEFIDILNSGVHDDHDGDDPIRVHSAVQRINTTSDSSLLQRA